MKPKVFLLCALTLAFLPAAAAANEVQASCDGWEFKSNTAVESVFVVSASLEILIGGVWVPVGIIDEDRDWIESPTERSAVHAGGAWPSALGAGQYRVVFTVRKYISDWADEAEAMAWVDANPNAYDASVTLISAQFDCLPAFNPATPGFWKNHAAAWPTSILTLGDADAAFGQACLLQLFSVKTKGDIRVKFVHHLVAAKLNILSGADPSTVVGYPTNTSTIGDLITFSDNLLSSGDIGCGGLSGPKPGGATRQTFEAAKDALDAFNNL